MARRIQRSRAKGWRQPVDAVYVGRPSVFGNPFEVGAKYVRVDGIPRPTLFQDGTRVTDVSTAVALYREWFTSDPGMLDLAHRLLGGRDLVCWCSPSDPCHADVLLELSA